MQQRILFTLRLVFRTDNLANNVNLDQTPQYAASDQGLHCLPVAS